MRKHIIEIALIALGGFTGLLAQQNIPCPGYRTEASRVDRNNVLAAREVRLCFDEHEIQQALTSVPRIKKRNPTESARRELDFGVAAAHEGPQDEALQHFVVAVQLEPYYWDSVAHLGSALVRMHQPSQALEFLIRAIMIDPRHASTRVNMAWAMLFLGKPDMAEGYARRAIGLEPDSEPANYVLAWALILQSKHSDDLRRALSIAEKRLSDASNLMMLRAADERQ